MSTLSADNKVPRLRTTVLEGCSCLFSFCMDVRDSFAILYNCQPSTLLQIRKRRKVVYANSNINPGRNQFDKLPPLQTQIKWSRKDIKQLRGLGVVDGHAISRRWGVSIDLDGFQLRTQFTRETGTEWTLCPVDPKVPVPRSRA
jgi:hypothetical protein